MPLAQLPNCLCCAKTFAIAITFYSVEELEREVVHARTEFAHRLRELVVGDDGGNCCEQSGSGGDQRFRNARSDCAQGCCASSSESVKGINDAPHSSEQSYERSNRA